MELPRTGSVFLTDERSVDTLGCCRESVVRENTLLRGACAVAARTETIQLCCVDILHH